MCAWCGRGFVPRNENSSEQFCSPRCKTRDCAFRLQQSLGQVRRTQIQQVLDNWRSLPKSGEERVAWFNNAVKAAGLKAKATLTSTSSRRLPASNLATSPGTTSVEARNVPETWSSPEEPFQPVGTPWQGEGVVELLNTAGSTRVNLFNCSAAIDRGVRLSEAPSWRFTIPETGGTSILKWQEARGDTAKFTGLAGFGMSLSVEEPEKITDFGLWIFTGNGGRFRWSSNNTTPHRLKKGWNHLRFSKNWMQPPLEDPAWGEVEAIQVYVQATSATSFNLGQVWAETRPKASLIFIHDGGYLDFDRSPGYVDLAARGVPVTWSVDCGLIGDTEHVSRDRLIEIGNENDNSISFHGWDSSVSGDYTHAEQAREETAKCQEWIAGLPCAGNTGLRWRTAWMQNRSPFSPATNDMVELNPMWDPACEPPSGPTLWPFTQPYNYRREALHHLSSRDLKELFEEAQQTHGVLVCYTHNVDDGITHISPELWTEFLELVDEGIAAGWLEAVTFETLTARDDKPAEA